jgi:TolB-like protein/DNA-binding winged helix-turn-helix (wHTH) protein/tetratricopeptide (TPR) repeat protein
MDGRGPSDILLFEGFRFDPPSGGLFRLDQAGSAAPVAVGSRALELLGLLVRRNGELVSKDEILAAVWPGRAVEEANLNVQVSKLRHILDQNRQNGSCIQTVTGYGYRFTADVTRADPAPPPQTLPPLEHAGGASEDERLYEPRAADPPTVQSDSGPPRPTMPPPRRFWAGVLATLIGVVGLVALVVATLNWHSSWSREARLKPPALSIVVLPLTNLSDDREQQYFADGVAEDLTTDLSRIGQVFVISHNTALTYRNKPVDTKQIGRELGVRYVLEGSVQRSGSQIRVSAQLSDAETAANLWVERFDSGSGDLFALQDEITRRIAVALNLELVRAEAARPTEDPDALDYILRGRASLMRPPTRDDRAAAIALFVHALALDPQSVTALSWLARTLAVREPDELTSSAAADVARAEELVERALAAAPRNPLAHYARGTVLRAQNRFAEAIPQYETAIAFDRNWLDAYANLGQCKFYTGSLEEYIPLVEQAIRLSPRDPLIGVWYGRIGLAHLLQSRIDESILWLEKARDASPGLPYIYSRLASAHALKGETARAAAELSEARRLSGDDHYATIAQLSGEYLGVPKIRALHEAVYFAGLRIAGMPEK